MASESRREYLETNLAETPNSGVLKTDKAGEYIGIYCKAELKHVSAPTQRSVNQTRNYPCLTVMPRAYTAMKYLENGYITLPQNQPKKSNVLGLFASLGLLN